MDEALLKKLAAAFKVEANEYMEFMRASLRSVGEADGDPDAWLEGTFRSMHSLKGAARAVNQSQVEQFCMSAESFFAKLRKLQRLPKEDEVELLYTCLDLIEANLADEDLGQSAKDSANEICAQLNAISENAEEPPAADAKSKVKVKDVPPAKPQPAPSASKPTKPLAATPKDKILVSEERLRKLRLDVEELTRLKLGTKFQSERLEDTSERMLKAKQSWNGLNPILNRLDELASSIESSQGKQLRAQLSKLWEKTEDLQLQLEPMESMIEESQHEGLALSRNTGRVIDSLESQLHELLLMPVSDGLLILHKIVRELAAEQSKLIDLKITGDQIEVDRNIIESLKDPFIHLIRNSVDHGIETPEERIQAGKGERGKIEIAIEQTVSGKVSVLYSDDGRGLAQDKLRELAVKSNIATDEEVEAMEPGMLLDTIFISGVSTAEKVTEISGRGLGMSIVREKIEMIGGHVSIIDSSATGTRFTIDFPVIQATFRGILFSINSRDFVFPTPSVESMQRVDRKEIKTVKNKSSFVYNGKAMPLSSLASILGIEKQTASESPALQILILKSGNRRLAVEVDTVIREQEVLVKSLGPQLKSVTHISGVAITGMGEPALLLNTNEIINSSSEKGVQPVQQLEQVVKGRSQKKRVLVAEDSFTSRMLLKNVLEASQYEVEVAVDGAAAFATLKTNPFDALISDVDMPRMNGFVLAEKVRSDRKLGEMPIVLITSLASEEDRERGVDAGANAYIIKSSFDQGELVSVLERLIGKSTQ